MKLILCIIIIVLVVIIIYLGRAVGYYGNKREEEIDKVQKFMEFYDILVRWIELKQEQKTLTEYFEQNEYWTVAIYGMKEIGMILLNELRQEGIEVKYAIDRNVDGINIDIAVFEPSCEMPEVDVIIVTASHYFSEIYWGIREFTKAEIIPIENILWGIKKDNYLS